MSRLSSPARTGTGRDWDRKRSLWSHSFNLGTGKVQVEMHALAAFLEGMGVRAHRDPSRGERRDSKHPVSDNSCKHWYFLWKRWSSFAYLFGSRRKGCTEVKEWLVVWPVRSNPRER